MWLPWIRCKRSSSERDNSPPESTSRIRLAYGTNAICCILMEFIAWLYWKWWVPSDDSTENNTTSVGGIVKYFWQTHKRTLKKNPRGFQASFCAAIGFKPSFSNFFSKASSHRLENGLRCYYCPTCCLKPALFEAHHSLIDFCKPNSWTKCNIHLDSHWRHWESIFSIFYQLICYWHFRISTHRVTASHSDDTLSTCNLIASPEAGPRPAVGELRLPTDQVNHFNHT